MNLKIAFVVCALVVVLLISDSQCKALPGQYQDGDVEYESGVPQRGRGGGLARRFTAWMNFIKNFFYEGNWENGGPPDFAEFMGGQVSKLVRMLDQVY